MKYASQALLRRRLLLPVLALGGLLLDWVRPLPVLCDSLAVNTDSAVAHYERATKLWRQDNYLEAEKEYRAAVRFNPNIFWMHFEYWETLDELGKYQEAEKEYQAFLRTRPEAFRIEESYSKYGQEFEKRGKHKKAEREFREALRLNPKNCFMHVLLATALAGQKRFEVAEDEYLTALKLREEAIILKTPDRNTDPAHPCEEQDIHYKLACLYARWGRKDKAIQSLRSAIDKGYELWPVLEQEEVFKVYRGDPKYQELAGRVKARWEERHKERGR